ncbi:type 2 isopentenyl-diphosphate Delta-isomerase [bacterium]|nr:type 2 isopentenyl-diphosphate Delta-isomerase [bacterium]
MASLGDITSRKDEHLEVCSRENVESSRTNFWDEVSLPPHRCLPEINFEEVQLKANFLGNSYDLPLLISSMTGGSETGDQINVTLAKAAQKANIPMGVGSQRIQLEQRDRKIFQIRKHAPKASLFANIGAVQLNYGVSKEDCLWLVEQLEAQALILHLNPLQEAIQQEGDRNFKSLLPKISNLKKSLSVPLIIKEVGCGIDLHSAKLLIEAGADCIDSAGMGGTHWGYVEGLRNSNRKNLGDLFRNWGTPTPELLKLYREHLPSEVAIVASGGIRSGVDMAKAIYLGANMVGMALPFLNAAQNGEEAVLSLIDFHRETLKTALFCMGMNSPEALRNHG